MEKDQIRQKNNLPVYVLLFIVTAAAMAVGYFIYGLTAVAIIRLACFTLLGHIAVIFTVNCSAFYNTLLNDNSLHVRRFFIVYVLLMAVCCILPAMPVSAWPLTVVYAVLTLLSNIPAGIISGCVCLVIASCLGNTVYFAYFVVYFLCGIIASLLLANIDEKFRIGLPVAVIEAVLAACLGMITVTGGSALTFESIIYPAANIAVTFLLIMLILKIYSSKVLFVMEDRYIALNDTECKLLSELKNNSPDDYMKTIHIVYFCDRLAGRLGLDAGRLKCAGLYHRVGVIGGARNWENTGQICAEQGLPEEVMEILHEITDTDVKMTKAESAVIFMADTVVSSIQYLFRKDKDVTLNYDSVIDAVFKQRLDSGVFNSCDITIRQFELMKKVFKEEKLYYDFLR